MKTRKRKDNAIDLPNADDLNDYFVSIGPKLSAKFIDENSSYSIRNNEKRIVLHQTIESEVTKILKNLKNKKSTGHDGISNKNLKCFSPIIEGHLARAINYCLLERIFPDSLKIAKLIPLYSQKISRLTLVTTDLSVYLVQRVKLWRRPY